MPTLPDHDAAVSARTRILGIGVDTVKGYTSQVLRKLEFNNRAQVVVLIHEAKLLEQEGGRSAPRARSAAR